MVLATTATAVECATAVKPASAVENLGDNPKIANCHEPVRFGERLQDASDSTSYGFTSPTLKEGTTRLMTLRLIMICKFFEFTDWLRYTWYATGMEY